MKRFIQITLQTIVMSGLIGYLQTQLNAGVVDIAIVMGAILVWFIIFALFEKD